MVVCDCLLQWIAQGALYILQLYMILIVMWFLHRYEATHIGSHAGSDYCCVQLNMICFNVRLSRYFRCLQLQHRGGLTGVCAATVPQPGEHWMKLPSFDSIRIPYHPAEVFVEPWLAVVAKVRTMITKSGKSWGLDRQLQVTTEWMSVNLHVLPKLYPAAYSCKLQVIPTVPRFAVSWSDVFCLICFQEYIEVGNSWGIMCDRYKNEILRRKGCLVLFASTYLRSLVRNTCQLACPDIRLPLLIRMKWHSTCRFYIVRVDHTYKPWHKRLSLPPCCT
jgi:hypothetical protein